MAEKKTKKKAKRKTKKKTASKKTPPRDNGKHPGGRPSIYTPELAQEICRRLANGESLRSICGEDGMPDKSTVLLWVVTPGHEFSNQYMRAREAAGYSHADRIAQIAEDVQKVDGLDANRARVAMMGYQWAAERMSPKAHNPKHVHEHTGKDGAAIIHEVRRTIVDAGHSDS